MNLTTTPNETQSVNYLNRITQNPNKESDDKIARQAAHQARDCAQYLASLDNEYIHFVACAMYPDTNTASEAVALFADNTKKLAGLIKRCQPVLKEVYKRRESQFLEHDKACSNREKELDQEIKDAIMLHGQKISKINNDHNVIAQAKKMGLTDADIEKLGYRQWNDENEIRVTKNQWAMEEKNTIDQVNQERKQIRRFKYTRNLNDLPPAVLQKLKAPTV